MMNTASPSLRCCIGDTLSLCLQPGTEISARPGTSMPVIVPGTLFKKGVNRFKMVFGLMQHPLKRGRGLEDLVEILTARHTQKTLGQAHSQRRLGGELVRQFQGPVHELCWRSNLEEESQRQSLLGFDQSAGQSQFGRTLIANQSLQIPGATVTRDDAKVDKGFTDHRAG